LANNSDDGLKKLVAAHVPVPAGKNRELLLDGALAAGNARLIRALTAEDPDQELRSQGPFYGRGLRDRRSALAKAQFFSP
jgi:hypothetical protein